MANPSLDVSIVVSTQGDLYDHCYVKKLMRLEAAERFVETYYRSLNGHRQDLASYYAPASTMPNGQPTPIILWNGNVIPDPATFQKIFEEQMPQSHYNMQGFDCQVLNPNYSSGFADASKSESGKNVSLLVTVSGRVVYGDYREGDTRGFSESFVLIPNPDTARDGKKHIRQWLIQSQNFRLVV